MYTRYNNAFNKLFAKSLQFKKTGEGGKLCGLFTFDVMSRHVTSLFIPFSSYFVVVYSQNSENEYFVLFR